MKRISLHNYTWWGPPKKFSTEIEERKISWLELFFDLVYVIAISRITHHLASHFSASVFVEYIYFFIMVFWGWLNGSLYHDLHGTSGLRTRLMTLWQMMIVAALVVTFNNYNVSNFNQITIVFMVMQLFITYLWWSVGIYDKNHRILNRPYTILYLMAFALMFTSLFVNPQLRTLLLYLSVIFNFTPPFTEHLFFRKMATELSLSPSMTERMGLFTIIIFGEVVLGIINGVSELHQIYFVGWLNFGLAVSIVFSLWWIFFTLVSDRDCKKGFVRSTILEILYIPTLMSLAITGVSFSELFNQSALGLIYTGWVRHAFTFSIGIFIAGIHTLMYLLDYPQNVRPILRKTQITLILVSVILIIVSFLPVLFSLTLFLLFILLLLVITIALVNMFYYRNLSKTQQTEISD